MNASTADLYLDMKARWAPSATQIALADAALTAELPEGHQPSAVFTVQLLVNKVEGVWDTDVEVAHVLAVFMERSLAMDFGATEAARLSKRTGKNITASFARHSGPGHWAIYEV